MNDLEIGDLLDRLHTAVSAAPIQVPSGTTERIRDRTRQLRRRRQTVLVGTCVAVVVGVTAGAVAAIPRGDHRITTRPPADSVASTDAPVVHPPVTTTPVVDERTRSALDTGIWETLPAPTLAPRVVQATALVGEQLVVWGGSVPNHVDGSEPPFADGAVLDLATDAWRPMATSPLTSGPATGVQLAGAALIVDRAGGAATYDPATDAWTSIDGPGIGLSQMVVSSGDVIGTTGDRFLRLTADGWHELPQPDAGLESAELVVASDRVFMFGTIAGATAFGYELTGDVWQPLPASPPLDATGGMIGVGAVEDRLVMVGWQMQAAEYDLTTGTWQQLPDLPGFSVKCLPQVTGVGSTTVVRMCGFVAVRGAVDPSAAWSISSPYDGSIDLGMHVTGDRLIVGGSMVTGDPVQQMLTPIRIGALTIDPSGLPADFRLTRTSPYSQFVTVWLLQSHCMLTVRNSAVPMVSQAAAYAAAIADPGAGGAMWGGPNYSIELTCTTPGADALTAAFSALQTSHEWTVAVDATATFDDLGIVPAATPEALIDQVATALTDRYTEDGTRPQTAIDWDADETTPLTATIEVLGFLDDSVEGIAFGIEATSSSDGWVVGHVTWSNICARGVAAGTNEQFCI